MRFYSFLMGVSRLALLATRQSRDEQLEPQLGFQFGAQQ